MSAPQTDTPRTDKAQYRHAWVLEGRNMTDVVVKADFARQLERELAEAKWQVATLITAEKLAAIREKALADAQSRADVAEAEVERLTSNFDAMNVKWTEARAELDAAHAQAKQYATEAGQLAAQVSKLREALELAKIHVPAHAVTGDWFNKPTEARLWDKNKIEQALAATAPEDRT